MLFITNFCQIKHVNSNRMINSVYIELNSSYSAELVKCALERDKRNSHERFIRFPTFTARQSTRRIYFETPIVPYRIINFEDFRLKFLIRLARSGASWLMSAFLKLGGSRPFLQSPNIVQVSPKSTRIALLPQIPCRLQHFRVAKEKSLRTPGLRNGSCLILQIGS